MSLSWVEHMLVFRDAGWSRADDDTQADRRVAQSSLRPSEGQQTRVRKHDGLGAAKNAEGVYRANCAEKRRQRLGSPAALRASRHELNGNNRAGEGQG